LKAQRCGSRCAAIAFAAGERLGDASDGADSGAATAPRGCHWAGILVPVMLLVVTMLLTTSHVHADTARITIGSATVAFPSSDPDAVPSVAASENPVSVGVRVNGSPGASQLTVAAGGDLVSGSAAIPISKVTWTAAGTGFTSGRLSSGQPQFVGQWFGKVDVTGQLRFWLENSWSYAAGNYSQNLVYTLIAY